MFKQELYNDALVRRAFVVPQHDSNKHVVLVYSSDSTDGSVTVYTCSCPKGVLRISFVSMRQSMVASNYASPMWSTLYRLEHKGGPVHSSFFRLLSLCSRVTATIRKGCNSAVGPDGNQNWQAASGDIGLEHHAGTHQTKGP